MCGQSDGPSRKEQNHFTCACVKGSNLQRYVEQLRRCLQLEASEQPHANASMGVVKLANEIVSPAAISHAIYKHPSHPTCVTPPACCHLAVSHASTQEVSPAAMQAESLESGGTHDGLIEVEHAVQSTLLLRSWALNPVLMRQLFQQLNTTADQVTHAVYMRVAVRAFLEGTASGPAAPAHHFE